MNEVNKKLTKVNKVIKIPILLIFTIISAIEMAILFYFLLVVI